MRTLYSNITSSKPLNRLTSICCKRFSSLDSNEKSDGLSLLLQLLQNTKPVRSYTSLNATFFEDWIYLVSSCFTHPLNGPFTFCSSFSSLAFHLALPVLLSCVKCLCSVLRMHSQHLLCPSLLLLLPQISPPFLMTNWCCDVKHHSAICVWQGGLSGNMGFFFPLDFLDGLS